MAETRATKSDTTASWGDPVLRPGRPADPGQPEPAPPVGQPDAEGDDRQGQPSLENGRARAKVATNDEGDGAASGNDENAEPRTESEDVQRMYAESYQRRLRRLLRQCERVNLLDFNVLSLAGWPDNYTLNAARRRRDTWVLSAIVAALIFLSGMTGVVPAWIAGGGFGAFVVILLMGIPAVRRLYSSKPSYLDLIFHRQHLLRDARRHIAHLEGEVGLIWQCKELSEFNPTLASPRFSTLKHLSEQRRLAGSLSRREHIRLYLIFMLEAEKAYERMQAAYFEGHQTAIDRGWKTVAEAVTEPLAASAQKEEDGPQPSGGSSEPGPDGAGAESGGSA